MTLYEAFTHAVITLLTTLGIGVTVYGLFYLCIKYIDPKNEIISYIIMAIALLMFFTLLAYINGNNLLGLRGVF